MPETLWRRKDTGNTLKSARDAQEVVTDYIMETAIDFLETERHWRLPETLWILPDTLQTTKDTMETARTSGDS